MLTSAGSGAIQFNVPAPPGSQQFGFTVAMLPNGNFVVTDPYFDGPGAIENIGAAFLYDPDGNLISTLTGSRAFDGVGHGGVTVLANGNFVVKSYYWSNGSVANVGAVTWGDAETGVGGVVSADNSLIGSHLSDYVGGQVVALSNGNYVVISQSWDNQSLVDAGAVTWGDGSVGTRGVVDAGNSLVGGSAGDALGADGVTPLSVGHYVVRSRIWDDGAIMDAGAVTWGNGNGGTSGLISASNSLVGSHTDDFGLSSLLALDNGNYVVAIRNWNDGANADVGAVTWGDGNTGVSGQISASNSLVGITAGDSIGMNLAALSNGHYVVSSQLWNNGAIADVGAVTWGNGVSGTVGIVGTGNSMIGTSANDQVGRPAAVALSNGHYVVCSLSWDDGAIQNVGAATWVDGNAATSGVVNAANSLIGSATNDSVCRGVTALSNGNYVVASHVWDNGAIVDAGAVTWRDGSTSTSGIVDAGNSLIGAKASDWVGADGVTALTDGDYVVASRNWDSGAVEDAGAVTCGNGLGGTNGLIGPGNSLVGSSVDDLVGTSKSMALPGGNYLVASSQWSNGAITWAGALTFGEANGGTVGTINPANSLIGSAQQDHIGGLVTTFSNGNYVVNSVSWSNGAITNAGAVTLGFADGSTVGPITSNNSVLGTTAQRGDTLRFDYDETRAQLVVGRRWDNAVTLFRPGETTLSTIMQHTPDPSLVGEAVSIVASVSSVSAPTSGSIQVIASTGETCSDNTPSAIDASSAEFSCQLQFATAGARTLRAEFHGTQTHGFSRSAAQTHTVIEDFAFADGFE